MQLSAETQDIVTTINSDKTKLGDIKKLAKQIKRNHELALSLWETGQHNPRLLAVLILDKKLLTQDLIDKLASDIEQHGDEAQSNQLADWLMANQLMKSKKTIALLNSWETAPSPILRRLFWYHQARLRWTGQTPPPNSAELLNAIEQRLATAEPNVQWTMNFCASQIGLHEPEYRARCIALGESLGLYKDDPVSKNCTPSYLPEFIRIEAAKREKQA